MNNLQHKYSRNRITSNGFNVNGELKNTELKEEIKKRISVKTFLEKSKNGMYVCPYPDCRSGTHENHSGAVKVYEDTNTWHCHKCHRTGDVIKLYMQIKGVDFKTALAELSDGKISYMPVKQSSTKDTKRKKEPDFTQFIDTSSQKFLNSPAQEYINNRGISTEVAQRFKLGYSESIYFNGNKSNALIIPVSKSFYFGRNLNPKAQNPKAQDRFHNVKGGINTIFNKSVLEQQNAPVFVHESVIDALSVIEVNANAIALNGVKLDLLTKELESIKQLPTLILCLDSDETGNKKTDELKEILKKISVKFIDGRFILNQCKDANEALTKDRTVFAEAVNNAIEQALHAPEPQRESSSSAGEKQQKPSFIKPVLNKHGEQIGEKISPPLLAQHIRENLHYFFVKDDTLSDIQRYVYKNGCYRRITDDELKSYIKSYITGYNIELLKMKDVQEVFLDLITDRVFVKSDLIDADENIINFTNGILKLDTMTLEPHSPDIKSTIQIDCEWSFEDVQTPVYDSFITTLTDGDKDVQHLLEQYTGVALSNVYGYRMKKALIMVGAGDCGKSQLKQLVEKMIGSNNYCSIDLEGLEKRFGTANLHRKRLAGSSDMGFMKIDELKIFKQVVGGDAIFGEFKGKNGFNFKYKGLLWFCANRKPHFGGDKGDWVYDRMIFIDCKNVIPKEKQDKQLLEKLYAERKGIIRKCVLALKTVIQAGYNYAIPTSAIDSLDDFKKKNDSVLMFIDECVVKRPIDGFVDNCTTKIMYEVYKEWCKDNRLFAEGKGTFRKSFITHFGYENAQDAIYKNMKNRYFKDYTLAPDIKDEYHIIYGYDALPEKMK